MRIVGLVGKKRSGKSTAAEALVRERGFVSIGFADALKDLALKVNPIIGSESLFDGDHEAELSLTDLMKVGGWEFAKGIPEVRRFLQELGTGVRDIDPLFWISAFENKIAALPRDACVVVPDVRFSNEARHIRQFGWRDDNTLLIRITRPGLDASDTHVSETEQLGIECDVHLVNNQTSGQLQDAVLGTMDSWMHASAA